MCVHVCGGGEYPYIVSVLSFVCVCVCVCVSVCVSVGVCLQLNIQ